MCFGHTAYVRNFATSIESSPVEERERCPVEVPGLSLLYLLSVGAVGWVGVSFSLGFFLGEALVASIRLIMPGVLIMSGVLLQTNRLIVWSVRHQIFDLVITARPSFRAHGRAVALATPPGHAPRNRSGARASPRAAPARAAGPPAAAMEAARRRA